MVPAESFGVSGEPSRSPQGTRRSGSWGCHPRRGPRTGKREEGQSQLWAFGSTFLKQDRKGDRRGVCARLLKAEKSLVDITKKRAVVGSSHSHPVQNKHREV
jgi:hypothetical protein